MTAEVDSVTAEVWPVTAEVDVTAALDLRSACFGAEVGPVTAEVDPEVDPKVDPEVEPVTAALERMPSVARARHHRRGNRRLVHAFARSDRSLEAGVM